MTRKPRATVPLTVAAPPITPAPAAVFDRAAYFAALRDLSGDSCFVLPMGAEIKFICASRAARRRWARAGSAPGRRFARSDCGAVFATAFAQEASPQTIRIVHQSGDGSTWHTLTPEGVYTKEPPRGDA